MGSENVNSTDLWDNWINQKVPQIRAIEGSHPMAKSHNSVLGYHHEKLKSVFNKNGFHLYCS
jgi:hypothetical protein